MDGRLYGAQFAIVIEFYLRCCGDHIEELNKISNSMSKIGLLYEKVSRKVTLDEVRFRPSSQWELPTQLIGHSISLNPKTTTSPKFL